MRAALNFLAQAFEIVGGAQETMLYLWEIKNRLALKDVGFLSVGQLG